MRVVGVEMFGRGGGLVGEAKGKRVGDAAQRKKLGGRRRQKSAPRSFDAHLDAAALANAPGEQG